ncbi:hypothetical protein [Roseibium marinum]|uniref:Uncharacterized protein n=1 Tax=Roseibium marinum TaxID=281252 RepID=A0A2S3US27_9HYPH|nr:hypothetical protein [Roseibium marinum]POF30521.1 hypothetical protein CLV41_106135 [Roseibium marinum]
MAGMFERKVMASLYDRIPTLPYSLERSAERLVLGEVITSFRSYTDASIEIAQSLQGLTLQSTP